MRYVEVSVALVDTDLGEHGIKASSKYQMTEALLRQAVLVPEAMVTMAAQRAWADIAGGGWDSSVAEAP